jgi:hypothetical protein
VILTVVLPAMKRLIAVKTGDSITGKATST